jgi:hypothetical protein
MLGDKFHLILIKNYHSASIQSKSYKKIRQIDALIIAVVEKVLSCKRYILRILLKILISNETLVRFSYK